MANYENIKLGTQVGRNTAKLLVDLPVSKENSPIDLQEFRKLIAEWDNQFFYPFPKEVLETAFQEIEIEEMSASLYLHENATPETPTLFFLHGCGFIGELKRTHQSLTANIASRLPCHILLPHYPFSPEVKAPEILQKIKSVFRAVLTSPERYGVSSNIWLIGYSAGGNLAWQCALDVLHDDRFMPYMKKINGLILLSPVVDVSSKTIENNPYKAQQYVDKMLQPWIIEQQKKCYLPTAATGMEPEYSPLYRKPQEFHGMPKTYIIAGEFDCILGDSFAALECLEKAGVDVRLILLEGQIHNHSCHCDLRDGVFTPDVIAKIIRNESVLSLIGDDGLGVLEMYQGNVKRSAGS